MIELPEKWTMHGQLPALDFAAADEAARELFDEDIVRLVDASGDYMLDVGWYPAGQPDGKFVARAIIGDNWDEPVEEFETRSVAEIRSWLSNWVEAISATTGEPASMSEGIVMLVEVFLKKEDEVRPDATQVPADYSRPRYPGQPFAPGPVTNNIFAHA